MTGFPNMAGRPDIDDALASELEAAGREKRGRPRLDTAGIAPQPPMTTRDDLVGRLREAHANSQQRVFGSHIFEEAASALEAMKAEIARLRDEIETADRNHRQMAKQMAELGRQLAACQRIAAAIRGGAK